MATRPYFYISNDEKVVSKNVEFEWFSGFSVAQKQRSIAAMHEASGKRLLEVSTKSPDELGRKLSAFNLTVYGYPLENVFQAGKKFENGGPYLDLLKVTPKEAKRDPRLRESGKIIGFWDLEGYDWPSEPKTAFYDYLYVKAVGMALSPEEQRAVANYDGFTDIEFNPEKSLNTQARSAALVKLLVKKYGVIPDNLFKTNFIKFHSTFVTL